MQEGAPTDTSVVSDAARHRDAKQLLAASPSALLVIDSADRVCTATGNLDAVFTSSTTGFTGQALQQIFGEDTSLITLVQRARNNQNAVCEHDMAISTKGMDVPIVDVHAVPLDNNGDVLLSLYPRTIPGFIERQADLKAAARSVSGLAAMLAHEIKNPLSGIRGAAQLLGRKAAGRESELTSLICREVDRIHGLVDELEAFSAERPAGYDHFNIHAAIDHAKRVALAGFASHISFAENYDPSLPSVRGHQDRLIQVFINLFKNAAEAIEKNEFPMIRITTSFRHVMWMTSKDGVRQKLPLEILVEDNGPGVASDITDCLFDPFVTSKEAGSGLGLALVARYIADMGGIIEYAPRPEGGAGFRLFLPMHENGDRA